eukprot:399294_1
MDVNVKETITSNSEEKQHNKQRSQQQEKINVLLLPERNLRLILNHGQLYVVYGKNTRIRGKILLAFRNYIYGETNIIDSFLQPETRNRGRNAENINTARHRKHYIWILSNTRKYSVPIKFTRKPGQVIWATVNIKSE